MRWVPAHNDVGITGNFMIAVKLFDKLIRLRRYHNDLGFFKKVDISSKCFCFLPAMFAIRVENNNEGSFSFGQVIPGKFGAVGNIGNAERRKRREPQVNLCTVLLGQPGFAQADTEY